MDSKLRYEVLSYFDNLKRLKTVDVKDLYSAVKLILSQQETGIGALIRFHRLLEQFVAEGVLKPFVVKDLDYMGRPTKVVRSSTKEEAKRLRDKAHIETLREETVWCSKICEISIGVSTLSGILKAVAINEWMKANSGADEVPHRERALEIFGDEKALDGVARKGLFGGRITLKALGCFHCPEPLHYEAFSKDRDETRGKPLLVVENSNTYRSCHMANHHVGRFAAIVYGKGNMINSPETGCDALWAIEEELGSIGVHYFGDLDPVGLAIPKGLSEKRQKIGLSAVEPERCLYAALIQKGPLTPCTTKDSKAHDPALANSWLGADLADAYLVEAPQKRWPQEGLGALEIEAALRVST